MQTTNFTTIILKPEDGKFLTQSDENIDIKQRIVATTVALGKNDTEENWREIDAEEAASIRDAQKLAYEEEAKQRREEAEKAREAENN